jgi:hypothetical protein
MEPGNFFLGTHRTHWLGLLDIPLFVSHRQLRKRKQLPQAQTRWALDSGGFTELAMHGRWTTTADEYVEAIDRYRTEIGQLQWAAPMDWMCEPFMLERTGFTVRHHQEYTVSNYLDLRDRGPFIPVLQGWSIDDYIRCVDLYRDAGVDLRDEPLVGIGSVCRRQHTGDIGAIIREMRPLRLHAFGVKKQGLGKYGFLLTSADSLAWSYNARRSRRMAGCEHTGRCNNCPRFALHWRNAIMEILAQGPLLDLAHASATGGRAKTDKRRAPRTVLPLRASHLQTLGQPSLFERQAA